MLYPYSSPLILNDTIFMQYGGDISRSTPYQRQAAYVIAEQEASSYLNTFLLPTIVTGTYPWPSVAGVKVILDHSYVQRILRVEAQSSDDSWVELDSYSYAINGVFGYFWLENPTDVYLRMGYGCINTPFDLRVAYEAGLPTGVASLPNTLMALTILADIELKEMVDPGALEGGAGDPGVIEWSDLSYRERRVALFATPIGSSARANKAARLLDSLRQKRALRFH